MTQARASPAARLLGPLGTYLLSTPILELPADIGLNPAHRVLDLSPDGGRLAAELARRVDLHHAPVAVSTSLAAARRAAREWRYVSVEVVAGSLTRLPFADSCFHLVLAAYLFRLLDDDLLFRVLLEVRRLLRPGGILLAWDYAPAGSERLDRMHRRLLTRHGEACNLRGFGAIAPLALYAGYKHVDRKLFRLPFLLPPIPRVAVMLQTARED